MARLILSLVSILFGMVSISQANNKLFNDYYVLAKERGSGDAYLIDVCQRSKVKFFRCENELAYVFQYRRTGDRFLAYAWDKDLKPTTAEFGINGKLLRLRKPIMWFGGFSYSGELAYTDFSLNGLFIGAIDDEFAKWIKVDESYRKMIFLRGDQQILLQDSAGAIVLHDLKSSIRRVVCTPINQIEFGDVSKDNKIVLLTDHVNIYILDLEQALITTVKSYTPGLFCFRVSGKPFIVSGQFAWAEDGSGFLFVRHGEWDNYLGLGLDVTYNDADLYFYDLKEKREVRLCGSVGKGGVEFVPKNVINQATIGQWEPL